MIDVFKDKKLNSTITQMALEQKKNQQEITKLREQLKQKEAQK